MLGIPPAKDTDAEDVAWGLQTAEALWKRDERVDAIVWLRRAAQAAGEGTDDDRALELARAAAELTDWMASSASGHLAEIDVDVDEDTEIGRQSFVPVAYPDPPPVVVVSERPMPPRSPAPSQATIETPEPSFRDSREAPPVPGEDGRSSVPPADKVHAGMFNPWATTQDRDERAPVSLPAPVPVTPVPSREPPPLHRSHFPEDEEVVTSVRPQQLQQQRADALAAALGAATSRPEAPTAEAWAEPPAKPAPALSRPAPPRPPPLPPRAMRPQSPSASTLPLAPSFSEAPARMTPAPPSPTQVMADAPGHPLPLSPPSDDDEPTGVVVPRSHPPAPPLYEPAARAVEVPEAAPPPEPPPSEDEPLPAYDPPRSDPPPPPVAVAPPAPVAVAPPARVAVAPPARVAVAPPARVAVAPPAPVAVAPPAPVAVAPPAPAPVFEPSAPRVSAPLDLADVEAFSDLPDDARTAFASAAEVSTLAEGEEVSSFALAYILSGTVDVAATMVDAAAARLEGGDVLRSRGTTADGVPMRLIGVKSGVVATWSDAAVQEAFRTCPWVEEDLRVAADRLQTLVGVTIGPLGERLDASIREQIISRLTMRTLIPGEVVVRAGEQMPGLLLVGVGQLELVDGDRVAGSVGCGEFLFPTEVLGAGKAPNTARAGASGALILFGDRMVAQELLVTCPPLLEVFAGM